MDIKIYGYKTSHMDHIFKILKIRLKKNQIWITCCTDIAFSIVLTKLRIVERCRWLFSGNGYFF